MLHLPVFFYSKVYQLINFAEKTNKNPKAELALGFLYGIKYEKIQPFV